MMRCKYFSQIGPQVIATQFVTSKRNSKKLQHFQSSFWQSDTMESPTSHSQRRRQTWVMRFRRSSQLVLLAEKLSLFARRLIGVRTKFFKSTSAFREWLAANHSKTKEFWVGFYKKTSGKPSITWPESV